MNTKQETSRSEHLKWCKQRALQYCDMGDAAQAYSSMVSDLGKHTQTQGHPAIQLGMMLMMGGHLDSAQKMREFINGFN